MDVQTEKHNNSARHGVCTDLFVWCAGFASTGTGFLPALRTALILNDRHSTRCQGHSSEILVDTYYTVTAHSSTEHPRCLSSCPSHRAGCVGLRSGWRWHQWGPVRETCGRGIFFWNPITSIILPKIRTAEFAYFLAKYDWDAECIGEQPDRTLTGLRLVMGKCLFQCLVSNKMFSDPFIIIRLIYSMFCVTYLAVLINHR